MTVHGRVGLVFGLFCSMMIFWHISTPANPDHVLNLIMHPVLAALFFSSIPMKPRLGVWVQISALALGAFLTGLTGSFHAAAAVGIVGMILLYAQGNFGTIGAWRLGIASFAQFANVSFSAHLYGQTPLIAIGHGVAWLVCTVMVVLLFWEGFNHMAAEIIKQNRDLLEVNKKLLNGDGKNGPGN